MREWMGMYPEELRQAMSDMGEKPFRAGQLFSWLHRGAQFGEMTNLSLDLREKLARDGIDQPVSVREKRVSRLDGTVKYLFSLPDGNCVEGVLMRYHYGNTLCMSTQVGCRMGCAFCASTLEGCVRNLETGELPFLRQHAGRLCPQPERGGDPGPGAVRQSGTGRRTGVQHCAHGQRRTHGQL